MEPTLKEKAYQYIKDKINMCHYLPGEFINELRIAEEIGIGRMPVREALTALKGENLIEVRPRKGTYVKKILQEEIAENYQIRRILEPAILTQYIHSYDKGLLLEYDSQFEKLDFSKPCEVYTLDISFHKYLVGVCKNIRIDRLYEEVMASQFRMGMYNSIMHTNIVESYYLEHHNIIMAILQADAASAEAAILHHISQSQISSIKSIQAKD